MGYATDGVSWVSEACIGAAAGACINNHIGMANQTFPAGATPHWDVTDISVNNLKAIWADTFNCNLDGTSGVDGTNVTMDWRCLELAQGVQTPASLTANGEGFGGPAEPIDCYTTQTASGTYGTWKSFLGFGNPPACASTELGDGAGDTQSATDHQNLTENQMGVIDGNQGTASPGHPNDAQWAIYFFSYGKFTQTCQQVAANTQVINPVGSTGAQIQGTCIGQAAADVTQYGSIGGIYADAKTIQGNGDLTGVTFLDPRILYNAYPNTAAPNPASAATLNFVGAGGFLCNPDTKTETDYNSGITYRTEIENAILGDGFFPLDVSQTTFLQPSLTGSTVPSAAQTAADYPADSNQAGGVQGYCDPRN